MPWNRAAYMTWYNKRWRKKNRKHRLEYARTYNKEHAPKLRAAAKRTYVRNRKQETKRLGQQCRFPGCKRVRGLVFHHDHKKQKRLQCCHSGGGCPRCRICMLCRTHNALTGMAADSLRVAKRLVKFLRRFH